MGKSRRSKSVSLETLQNLETHKGLWIIGAYDFIDQEMSDDEIDYVKENMENISSIISGNDGIFRAESTTRTFNTQQLTEGKEFKFEDGGNFKAFSKEQEVAENHSLGSVLTRKDVTLFNIKKGKAYDATKDLDTHDEQEVWISNSQTYKVTKITETTPQELGYNKKFKIPSKTWERIKNNTVRLVEVEEV